jgi:CRP-like cAMP-binding protein
MLDGLERVELTLGEVLYEPDSRVKHVYFPNDSLISLIVMRVEVGLVGRESMAGATVALGQPTSPMKALVQGAGSAMRMDAEHFRDELARDGGLRPRVDRCIFVAMTTAMQIAACNKTHVLESRLARWLLMVRDRVAREEFAMTQDFLAQMLGVRRAGVTEAASALQERKQIEYSRGKLRITDVEALRATACACYGVIRQIEKTAAA